MIEIDYELSAQITNALRARRRRSAFGFSPSILFAAGQPGFWGEVKPDTLWQDTARTTPVTAVGQSVASWLLNTGAGPIYATQGTAASRPTYQVDGAGRGFLLFDGVDDWLQTPSVDFSGVDKVFVCAGVRKLSDAARGIAMELGAGAASAAFLIDAPGASGATQRYQFASVGTLAAVPETALGPAPDIAVISGIGDIANDVALLRRNGVQVGSGPNDQGTGNYSNAIVYFGSRGGTSLPFNGRIHGIVVRGTTTATSAERLAATETWMNARTGAY